MLSFPRMVHVSLAALTLSTALLAGCNLDSTSAEGEGPVAEAASRTVLDTFIIT